VTGSTSTLSSYAQYFDAEENGADLQSHQVASERQGRILAEISTCFPEVAKAVESEIIAQSCGCTLPQYCSDYGGLACSMRGSCNLQLSRRQSCFNDIPDGRTIVSIGNPDEENFRQPFDGYAARGEFSLTCSTIPFSKALHNTPLWYAIISKCR